MHIDQQQEQFSIAYVRAVAAVAGFGVVEGPRPDDDSVDLTISAKGPMGSVRSPRLDVQMKSTRVALHGDPISYALSIKNHEDLRHIDYMAPRILVLVLVPADPQSWLEHSEAQLVLRHCGYWLSLRGEPNTRNAANVTVRVPRANSFSVEGLRDIMQRVSNGGSP